MCLGANNIIMTKQATLGPIDPSVNTPLNPHIPGAPDQVTMPVNVEAIRGFIEMVKTDFGIKNKTDMAIITKELMNYIHPLVLGQVFRAKSQIKMLAKNLLKNEVKNENTIEGIINFLCSDSGSHDYTINRKEAKDGLGLPVSKPDDELYLLINNLYKDFSQELNLNMDYSPLDIIGADMQKQYSKKRALIESINGGCNYFVSEGILAKLNQSNIADINDTRFFEGWRYESK
jgi:hypothetical protein